jgi:hypothetical protein
MRRSLLLVAAVLTLGGCFVVSWLPWRRDPPPPVTGPALRGRSWDVDGLYVADSSILPTSLGVNPCYTVYALGRYIAHQIVKELAG